LLKPLKQQIRRAEDEIEKRENRLKMLNEDMMAASSTNNGKQIAEISKQIHACNAVIEKQFTDLETLHDKKGKLEEKYTAALGT